MVYIQIAGVVVVVSLTAMLIFNKVRKARRSKLPKEQLILNRKSGLLFLILGGIIFGGGILALSSSIPEVRDRISNAILLFVGFVLTVYGALQALFPSIFQTKNLLAKLIFRHKD